LHPDPQKVFRAVNEWLSIDQKTKQRNMKIRTYKCVPLRDQAGSLLIVVDFYGLYGYYLVCFAALFLP
jgi:hypothetical protein